MLTNLCIKHESLLTVLIEFISIRFICPSDFGMHPQLSVMSALIKGERFPHIQQVLSTGGWPLRLIENKVIFISSFHSWSLKELFCHSLLRTILVYLMYKVVYWRENILASKQFLNDCPISCELGHLCHYNNTSYDPQTGRDKHVLIAWSVFLKKKEEVFTRKWNLVICRWMHNLKHWQLELVCKCPKYHTNYS